MQVRTMVMGALSALILGTGAAHAAEQQACVGNSVAMTGPAAFGGMTIKMGAEVALDEINARGGVLGKPLRFIQYDDVGAPPRGVDNTRRIALADKCIAILGGYHSTVAAAQAEPVNEIGIPYIGVLAANTKAVENGHTPNYMFRVSAKDKWVAQFLVAQALKSSKNKKIAFLYENTGWGNGAKPDVEAAMKSASQTLAASETFNWGDNDMAAQVTRIRDSGADTLLLWGLDREGNQVLRSMDKIGYKPTVLGAWGIGGNLGQLAGPLANGVRVMQTFSFMGEQSPRTKALWEKIQTKYGLKEPEDIKMASGTADAYDAMYILAAAIEKAGSYDRTKVREALYSVNYKGLVADYAPAFDAADPERQDAILPKYYKLTVWVDGRLLPIEQTAYASK